MTPLAVTPPQTALMRGMMAGSVRWYAAAVRAGHVVIDDSETRLPLRHSHHRYLIDGPNGVQRLTVPLTGDTANMATPLREVRIAEHGNWRRLHWGALYSAYGRTPYFDYIASDLEAVIMGRQTHLLDLILDVHRLVVDFLDLPLTTTLLSDRPAPLRYAIPSVADLRPATAGKGPDTLAVTDVPYYQVWSARHPFIPALSILDTAMNLGREAILTLQLMHNA